GLIRRVGLLREGRRGALRLGAAEVLLEILVVAERSLAQDANHVVSDENLLLEQLLSNEANLILLLCQEILAALVGLLHNSRNLQIDLLGCGLGKWLLHAVGVVLKMHRAHYLRHTPLSHHVSCHLGNLLEVITGACRHSGEVKLLRHTTTHGHGHSVHELVSVHQSSLVNDIGNVGTREARSESRQTTNKVFLVFVGYNLVQVDLEDLLTTLHCRSIDEDVSIESSRSHQSLVQHIRSVSTSKDDHLFSSVEAIHFRKNLVQRRFTFVVTAKTLAALLSRATNGINLVDKDDARGVLTALGEQISYTRRSNTDKHLNEFGTAHTEEGYSRLTCRGLGKQRLTKKGGAKREKEVTDSTTTGLVADREWVGEKLSNPDSDTDGDTGLNGLKPAAALVLGLLATLLLLLLRLIGSVLAILGRGFLVHTERRELTILALVLL
ncbi:hypothetical protein HG531_011607, partial [Fusarium graminearum]